jgi:cytoskeletal protein RodZ
MTTHENARQESRLRFGAGERGDPGDPGPGLPDRLAAARERKGVDLVRAERDTKIRVRYLSALETGDYRDLPGAVYTKGFLRNYALYLGLDPEDVLRQWRRERGEATAPEAVIVPPRPLAEPARPLNFSPQVVVAALLTAGVVLFFIYLGAQLLRYTRPPDLAVTSPATAVHEVTDSSSTFRLAGTTSPGAIIEIATPGQEQPFRVTPLSNGEWFLQVDLRHGQNRFDIKAVNPETKKESDDTRQVVITVPFLEILAPTLTVSQPVEATTYGNGAIAVSGTTTNAETVTLTTAFLGLEGSSATPKPGSSATPGPNRTVNVADDGSFEFPPLELTTGRWAITVTATSEQGQTATQTRNISVAFSGVTLVVSIRGGPAWIKVWVDGELEGPLSGRVIQAGRTLTFTGDKSIEVRTGSSGSTHFTLNGKSLGSLGPSGVPQTWLFAPPDDPVETQRT